MISIITPIYNGSRFLRECLASFAQQDQRFCELVLVDDGSTDDSLEICNSFAADHANVVVIHQGNAGQFAARERGIRESHGDHVMFLDSDDKLRPDAIALIQSCFDEHPQVGCVCFRFARGLEETYRDEDTVNLPLADGLYEGDSLNKVRRALCEGDLNNLCNKAFRADLVKSALGELSSQTPVRHGEDLYQLIPIARRTESFAFVGETLYFYRDNESSTSRQIEVRQIDDLATVFGYLRTVADSWGKQHATFVETGFNKHLYWCLYGTVAGCAGKDVRNSVFAAAATAQRAFHGRSCDYADVLRPLRADQRLPMEALAKGCYGLCKAELRFGHACAQLLARIR